ncbi:MAG: efflux RND transporter periplasmic adaptor subunit [Candidatus Zixiibacteriota bacterium]|nr:MAG: efflux RND transporter periplasmic adaptor subunit [candidate division Zixibacteria bacterium]
MKKFIWIAVIVVVLAAVIFVIVKSSGNNDPGYKLVEVTRDNIVEKALATGQIEPLQEIQVKSKISGIVKTLHVEIGDDVKAGERLITIAPNPTPLEFAEAKRNLELAQVDFDNAESIFNRKKELFNNKLSSQEQYDIAQAEYSESRLRLQMANEKFDLLQKGVTVDGKDENTIISPITGTVLEKLVNEGDPVVPLTSYQAGTPLLSLAPMEKLIFKGTVDEIDVGKLTEGMPCDIKVGALPGEALKGRLSKISPKAKKQDNTTLFDLEIQITETGDKTLRAGYSANADIIISKKDSILVIPERLVEFKGDTAFVEIADSAGAVESRKIEVGLSDGLNIEIIDGLALGDNVVERPPKEIE